MQPNPYESSETSAREKTSLSKWLGRVSRFALNPFVMLGALILAAIHYFAWVVMAFLGPMNATGAVLAAVLDFPLLTVAGWTGLMTVASDGVELFIVGTNSAIWGYSIAIAIAYLIHFISNAK